MEIAAACVYEFTAEKALRSTFLPRVAYSCIASFLFASH